ncbi:hypothetical protein TRFO_30102 [Tritrichomonas foetus]|uniref:Right handed beta helix domain-containing protein n=1 Tax=Tritrichomonas foetus TaxID=1144522 RepID=A0A1J4JYX4_9EUKA|nr:hypothetical protein TRFO_30102 [Tritrichomonas foetus]|eukprot:OHT02732.1 hypothetical protein TRFO_30102 [Tritrichomonas foetus]
MSHSILLENSKRIENANSELKCFRCNFLNIHADDSNGGAINSGWPVSVDYSTFIDCSSQCGGAIFASNDLIINNTFFHKLSANLFGFISIGQGPNFTIFFTSLHIETSQGPGFKRYNGVISEFQNSNFTQVQSSSIISLGEFGQTHAIFSFNKIENCSSEIRNGGISFWQCHSFKCSDSLFTKITVFNSEEINGIAIWLDGGLQQGEIKNCGFSFCHAEKGKVIYLMDSQKVEIGDCLFDSPKEKCFHQHNSLIIQETNQFSLERVDFGPKLSKNVITTFSEASSQLKSSNFKLVLYIGTICSVIIMSYILLKY